jgi:hypothetical protein
MGFALVVLAFFAVHCASTPEPPPEPEVKPKPTPPPPPPKFISKPYHTAMSKEMEKSYHRADEIVIGVYSGTHEDDLYGLAYFFEDFITFDKDTLSWGQVMNVIFQVLPHKLEPEIISAGEFRSLSDLDRVGICWDSYEQVRDVYLIQGEKMLIFLEQEYDEENNRSTRHLIDTYPVTKECNAKAVFDSMVRNLYLR